MKIQTKYHGEVEIDEKDVFRFEHGIPGFLEEKQFVLLPFTDDSLFMILQSLNTEELGFVLTNPFNFFKDYDIELPEHVVEELEIESENDVVIYSILTVQDPFEKTTCNLQAPVILNEKQRQGRQVILSNTSYTTKHYLVEQNVVGGLK
ncbi:flagellar assembly protein FliW [Litchfieldia alkalitelluris]|uniref:flagellar assembly protein FliW n=1 Tax=Litchfieldia alkalitelluris TaxID=304268 RepID=UPI000997ACA0|nr:flagellar assembly protein FliW [Litchfieldia alkalitelluris]